ncbi:ThiF family adenylyltransferase [Pontibacter korlensis]|uniref:Thiamine biosynthesis protein ThiF n=1 Tax=Pontibacter korlensis TaxID=400092 RepID=A0A0E3UVS7_9BACT|nr:ThiF family adenylyltransferase [Pontibacter korlensis]AKD02121.1 hypothetical protein PKOR_01915 [Pontibacter korlensis]
MHKSDIEFYNSYFAGLERCRLEQNFRLLDEEPFYHGRICIDTAKGPLDFEVLLPEDYPFGEAHFYCRTIKGYNHQNLTATETLGGNACLNTPFVDHLHTRLSLDVEKLYQWIEDLYINETRQEYEYPAFKTQGKAHLLFSETANDLTPDRFRENLYGTMTYTVLNQRLTSNGKAETYTLLAQQLGGKESSWSKAYKGGDLYQGVWVFVAKEPVVRHRLKMDSWEQLRDLLPSSFSDFFLDFCKKSARYMLGPDGLREYFLLALGYAIPTLDNKQEVHWDLLLVPVKDFRRRELKRRPKYIKNLTEPLLWDGTTNSSYQRFFGRGMLSKALVSKNILIIGAGAIGSSLSELLVRGGLTKLTLSDSDTVEPGNVCRSKLTFKHTNIAKVLNLRLSLLDISPFVDIETIAAIQPTSPKGRYYENTASVLNQFDLIFDCSADNQVLQMLSYGNVISPIVSLSITNKARHLLCLSSWDSPRLIEMKSRLLDWLKADHYPTFKPGTGCWHFTFEASYPEINALLNKALNNINTSTLNGQKPETFILSAETNSSISKLSFIKYQQPELGLKLKVSSATVETVLANSDSFFPNEYGGLLMGSYSDDFSEALVFDVILPSKFKSSPTSFVPDTDELNKKLNKYGKEHDSGVEYLGEWHSHPKGSGQYSPQDFASLKKVAEAGSVAVANPLLLIASGYKGEMQLSFYVFSKNKLYKFSPYN